MRGKITHWNDEKGFGFIISEDSGEKLFFHISAVKTQDRRPQVGDAVLYESIHDAKGRPKAKTVVIEGVVPKQKTYSKKRIHTEPPKKYVLDYVAIVLVITSLSGAAYRFFQTGNIEKAIPFGVILVVAVVLLNRPKKPKEKNFSCARCGKIAEHDKRTVMAWNNGFIKLYCNACHQIWLSEHPNQTRSVSSGGQGCLGVSAFLLIILITAVAGTYHWFV